MTTAKLAIALIAPLISLLADEVSAEPLMAPDPAFALTHPMTAPEARVPDPFRVMPVREPLEAALLRPRVITTATLDRARWLIAARAPKTAARGLDWGSGSLTLRLLRAKSSRQPHETSALTHNRFALWSADVSLDQDLGGRDTLSLTGSLDIQRRRPAHYLGTRNIYRTQTRAASAQWTHDRHWRLSLGLFDRNAASARSPIERTIELAGGAPPITRGMNFSAGFSPSGDPERFSLGLDLRRERYSVRDATLLGRGRVQAESRVAVFVQRGF